MIKLLGKYQAFKICIIRVDSQYKIQIYKNKCKESHQFNNMRRCKLSSQE